MGAEFLTSSAEEGKQRWVKETAHRVRRRGRRRASGVSRSRPRRTIVQAIDDLAAELRVANALRVLDVGQTAWVDDKGERAKTPEAIANVKIRNELRARVRAWLGTGS